VKPSEAVMDAIRNGLLGLPGGPVPEVMQSKYERMQARGSEFPSEHNNDTAPVHEHVLINGLLFEITVREMRP
jgi:hypothetical protein